MIVGRVLELQRMLEENEANCGGCELCEGCDAVERKVAECPELTKTELENAQQYVGRVLELERMFEEQEADCGGCGLCEGCDASISTMWWSARSPSARRS